MGREELAARRTGGGRAGGAEPPAGEVVGYAVYAGDPELETGWCLACADGDALCDGVAVYEDDEGRPLRRCACCGAPL